jgi:hypothetical protein
VSTWSATTWPDAGILARVLQLATSIVLGLAVLAASARILRIAEFDEAMRRVLRRAGARR